MALKFLIVYILLGLVWFFVSGLRINAKGILLKIPKLILFFFIWPLVVLVRIERAFRIGKFLKPHSKWHLITRNKVVVKEKKEKLDKNTLFAFLPLIALLGCTQVENRYIEGVEVSYTETAIGGVRGIDVSHYQGNIDWAAVSQHGGDSVQFAFIKATEGKFIDDHLFVRNLTLANQAGIPAGPYHFYRPGYANTLQVCRFASQLQDAEFDLAPLIDVEVHGGLDKVTFVNHLLEFLELITEEFGRPTVYTSENFYNEFLRGQLDEYPLIIAKYSSQPPRLNDGRTWIGWQYSESEEVDGIRGGVDRIVLAKGVTVNDLIRNDGRQTQ
jgi:lysozyme